MKLETLLKARDAILNPKHKPLYWINPLNGEIILMSKPRFYNVKFYRTNKNGEFIGGYGDKTKMNSTPMTHKEACTFKSKLTPEKNGCFMIIEDI